MADISASIPRRDLDRLGSTLAMYAQGTGKDLTEVSNRGLRQIAIFASSKTPKADPAKIAAVLRKQVATKVFTRTGKRLKKAKAIYKRTRLANAIIRARAHAAGETLTDEEVEQRANKMLASRIRSVRFVRSGYIPALTLTKARRSEAGRQLGKPKGSATLATPSRIEAVMSNRVQGRKGGLAVRIGQSALLASIPEVERDMRQYAEKKLAERTARANASP